MKRTLHTLLLALCCVCSSAQPFQLRLLNHWDNPNGTVERGHAGRSIWKWERIPSKRNGRMPQDLKQRYEEYGRINQSYGINGTVLNNVNAKPVMLTDTMLVKTKHIADILRPYGIKVYLSVNFATPKALGELPTADPLDTQVREWWVRKAAAIYKLIPDFGGFLVKANSEGEPGPMDYDRTHVDGANMLADALLPHGGIVMWRAFVYAPQSRDRASQASEEFVKFDGQFRDNVIIQIKNGPVDFQPREPVSPLFFGLKKTKMMVEFQITQEYTGGSIQTCFLAPMWREFFHTIEWVASYGTPTPGEAADGAPIAAMPNLVGAAGVANIGDADNWTANDLGMANWYAFGRLANDCRASSEDIARQFLTDTFGTTDEAFLGPMTQLLVKSHETVVDYMMPLGLHHIFAGNHHYGPEPWYAPAGTREDWLPRYYHRADSIGIGFNRSTRDEPCATGNEGSGNTLHYPEPLRTMYNNVETCPENLLLWFHHVPWDYTMSNGLSLWQNLCYTYDRGVAQARQFVQIWQDAKPYVKPEIHERQLRRFTRQARDAQWWRDACLLYFQKFSARPFPADSPAPQFELDALMRYRLRIDNYSSPDIDALP